MTHLCALLTHQRQDMLTGHDGAAQVDGMAMRSNATSVIWLSGASHQAGNAYTDIVVEDIDAPPTLPCGLDHRRERCLVRQRSASERKAFATRPSCHCNRFPSAE